MRSATARAARRRGSSSRILRPCAHGSSSRASGTTVLLPAPGGATSTALACWRRLSSSCGNAASTAMKSLCACGAHDIVRHASQQARWLHHRPARRKIWMVPRSSGVRHWAWPCACIRATRNTASSTRRPAACMSRCRKFHIPAACTLDIESDDVEAEARRLEALGAKRIEAVRTWIVMEAPTGQRFCVVRPTVGRISGTRPAAGNSGEHRCGGVTAGAARMSRMSADGPAAVVAWAAAARSSASAHWWWPQRRISRRGSTAGDGTAGSRRRE